MAQAQAARAAMLTRLREASTPESPGDGRVAPNPPRSGGMALPPSAMSQRLRPDGSRYTAPTDEGIPTFRLPKEGARERRHQDAEKAKATAEPGPEDAQTPVQRRQRGLAVTFDDTFATTSMAAFLEAVDAARALTNEVRAKFGDQLNLPPLEADSSSALVPHGGNEGQAANARELGVRMELKDLADKWAASHGTRRHGRGGQDSMGKLVAAAEEWDALVQRRVAEAEVFEQAAISEALATSTRHRYEHSTIATSSRDASPVYTAGRLSVQLYGDDISGAHAPLDSPAGRSMSSGHWPGVQSDGRASFIDPDTVHPHELTPPTAASRSAAGREHRAFSAGSNYAWSGSGSMEIVSGGAGVGSVAGGVGGEGGPVTQAGGDVGSSTGRDSPPAPTPPMRPPPEQPSRKPRRAAPSPPSDASHGGDGSAAGSPSPLPPQGAGEDGAWGGHEQLMNLAGMSQPPAAPHDSHAHSAPSSEGRRSESMPALVAVSPPVAQRMPGATPPAGGDEGAGQRSPAQHRATPPQPPTQRGRAPATGGVAAAGTPRSATAFRSPSGPVRASVPSIGAPRPPPSPASSRGGRSVASSGGAASGEGVPPPPDASTPVQNTIRNFRFSPSAPPVDSPDARRFAVRAASVSSANSHGSFSSRPTQRR